MPTSDPCNITTILQYVISKRPRAVLDVGIGCGKYGLLFREYLDRQVHISSDWKIMLHGVEVFEPYITPLHKYIYTNIFNMNYIDFLSDCPYRYDLVFFGDVLEHFDKPVARELLVKTRGILTPHGCVVASTPNFLTNLDTNRPGAFGNKNECHHCQLTDKDFSGLGYDTKIIATKLLTVFMEQKG